MKPEIRAVALGSSWFWLPACCNGEGSVKPESAMPTVTMLSFLKWYLHFCKKNPPHPAQPTVSSSNTLQPSLNAGAIWCGLKEWATSSLAQYFFFFFKEIIPCILIAVVLHYDLMPITLSRVTSVCVLSSSWVFQAILFALWLCGK